MHPTLPKAPVPRRHCIFTRFIRLRRLSRARRNKHDLPILDHPQNRPIRCRTQRPLPVVARLIRLASFHRNPGGCLEQSAERQIDHRSRPGPQQQVLRVTGTNNAAQALTWYLARHKVRNHVPSMQIGKRRRCPSLNCWLPPRITRPSGLHPAHRARYRTPPRPLPVPLRLYSDPQPTSSMPEPASQPERRVLPGIAAQFSTHLRAEGASKEPGKGEVELNRLVPGPEVVAAQIRATEPSHA